MPEKAFFRYFLRFFLGGNLFFSPTFAQIFSGTRTFSRAQNDFFSRVEVMISRAQIKEFSRIFCNFQGEICDFFLAHRFFFLGCKFAKFFTGTIFFSRAVFKIFSRALANFLGQNLENFLGENIFFLGAKKNTAD